MRSRTPLVVSLTSLLLGATLLLTPAASGQVLVSAPPQRVCQSHTFEIGVWNQPSGGSRLYRVSVYGPQGVRVFYRHGVAPDHWLYWHIKAVHLGTYRTLYQSGVDVKPPWRTQFHTVSHTC